jgi:ribosome-associated translation inhibitor RaiA
MIVPVQTTFRNMNASAAVAARVQEEAEKLDKYFRRITSLSRRRIDTIDMATRFT